MALKGSRGGCSGMGVAHGSGAASLLGLLFGVPLFSTVLIAQMGRDPEQCLPLPFSQAHLDELVIT